MGFMANIDKDLPRKDMKMLRPENIKMDRSHNVRGYIGDEPDAPDNIKADFAALVESVIASNGIWSWNPLAVRSDGEAGWIRKGYRRLAAVLEANKRGCNIVAVPCVPDLVAKDEKVDVLSQLAANENSASLRPIDEAFAYQRLQTAGMTVDDIAVARRASPSVIKDRLALLALTSETRAMVAGDLIPLTRATKMGKKKTAKENPLTDAEERKEVADIMANTIATKGSGKPRMARTAKKEKGEAPTGDKGVSDTSAKKQTADVWARIDKARGLVAAEEWALPGVVMQAKDRAEVFKALGAMLDYLTGEAELAKGE